MKRVLLTLMAVLATSQPIDAQQPIAIGIWTMGDLNDQDRRLVDGQVYDEYDFNGIAENVYSIDVDAEGFIPSIIVSGPDGYPLLEKAAAAGRARELVVIRTAGPHRVVIAGSTADSRGRYRLRVRRIGPVGGPSRGLDQPPPPPPPPMATPPTATPPPPTATPRPPMPSATARPSPPAGLERLDAVPRASVKSAIRGRCLEGELTYGAVFDRLKRALRDYGEPGLFLTPSGFALATRFERIDDEGVSIAAHRWDTAPFYNSLWQVMLHRTQPGRYRSYTFVYDTGIADSSGPLPLGTMADRVAGGGGMELPAAVRARRGGPDHYLQVFVYEYERPFTSAPTRLVRPTPRYEGHLGSPVVARVRSICEN